MCSNRWGISRCLILILSAASLQSVNAEQANDISLARSYPPEKLQAILLPAEQWQPYPKITDRTMWEGLSETIQQDLIRKAEAVAELDVPMLPASVYLQFKRNGNRSNYQDIWFDRRERLHILVVAECVEHKGRFLDPITDLIWAICEETSWTFPAHIGAQKTGVGLPDVDDQVVALFSAQTANLLAVTNYLLGEELDKISPSIRLRIDQEIQRRTLKPFLEKSFGWMGYAARSRKHYPNNWNPWICSNVLLATLLTEKDETQRVKLVHKALDCLDNFLTYYPYDGSCDEGPSYWGRAGASLLDALEHLYSATDKKLSYYEHPLIQEIGRFIYRVHIADDYFVCLGDCDARFNYPKELVFRYGKRIGDKHLMAMGAYGVSEDGLFNVRRYYDLNRFLHLLFNGRELLKYEAPSPPLLQDVWLGHPDMQMMAARDQQGSTEGLYLAAWGGHNAQSHNHNDVGNFLIYADGKPVLIDIGRPTYRKQTFSSRRYEIWAFQSGYHNLPAINGADQKPGRSYAAQNVVYKKSDSGAHLQMDIAKAYPKEADLYSWQRRIDFHRRKNIVVTDQYELNKSIDDIVENFIVAGRVIRKAPGKLILHDREGTVQLLMEYDPNKLTFQIEEIELIDAKLKSLWGDTLNRIQLKTIDHIKSDRLEFQFSLLN